MTSRSAIAQLAKVIGHELTTGDGPSKTSFATGPILAEAGATPELVRCLFAEARRKRADDRLINAYAFMLGTALSALRIEKNGGNTSAARGLQEARDALEESLARGAVAPATLLLTARAFAQADLDPGPALQGAMAGAMDGPSGSVISQDGAADLTDHLADIAEAFNNDAFAIHAELAASGAAFPPEHRASMAAALAISGHPAVSEAAIGFVLSPDAATATATLAALAGQALRGQVSSTLVERLVRLRPWLAEIRHPDLDAAIRALRPQAAPAAVVARPDVKAVLASLCDGAGAQSLFAITKRGRRFVLASVLLKSELGIADAWVRDDMSRAEADEVARAIVQEAGAIEISTAFLELRLAHALAANIAGNLPPPFGLLQVTDVLGLGPLYPIDTPLPSFLTSLLADVPERQRDASAVLAAHRDSKNWPQRFEVVSSWFEAGDAVEQLLNGVTTRKRRSEAVSQHLLPTRRTFWAERCAWTAATLKDQATTDENWIAFALVARDLAADGPLDAMPITALIANATIAAFERR